LVFQKIVGSLHFLKYLLKDQAAVTADQLDSTNKTLIRIFEVLSVVFLSLTMSRFSVLRPMELQPIKPQQIKPQQIKPQPASPNLRSGIPPHLPLARLLVTYFWRLC
jgi:hypothetical protein